MSSISYSKCRLLFTESLLEMVVSLGGLLFSLHMVNTVLPSIAAPGSLGISGFGVDLE